MDMKAVESVLALLGAKIPDSWGSKCAFYVSGFPTSKWLCGKEAVALYVNSADAGFVCAEHFVNMPQYPDWKLIMSCATHVASGASE